MTENRNNQITDLTTLVNWFCIQMDEVQDILAAVQQSNPHDRPQPIRRQAQPDMPPSQPVSVVGRTG